MPAISQKGLAMPQSPIRKLVPYAEQAQREGKEIYHLNIGQPDIKTPKVALEAVKNNTLEIVSYSHSAGFESYRNKLSKYYQKNNIPVEPEDIIVTTGGSEALLFAMGTVTDPGDEVIIPEPFYANYNGFATSANVNVVPVKASIEDDFALPAISEFEKLITDKTRAIILCNPGNPTGYLYTQEEMQQLAELALKYDLFIIADEVYREFAYDGAKHHSVMCQKGLEQHAIMIDSVSKRYSMCGARIGCVVSKNKAFMETALKFAQARLSPPTFAQIASEAALDTPDSYFENVINEYTERRNTLVEALKNIDGVKVGTPKGAFYCIAELPIEDADDFAKWLLESYDYNGETVMIAPAAGFYSTPNTGSNQVRIAYVLKKENLLKAVTILEKALKAYQAQ
ncbi:pyridoxal phosphate-dependent aminotransferase [Haloflavibacter putidus]|uniref:Aminotransferase n=1 Tax=Haloflavibacter putidus TaxID=2576776 RepID=A0A507ZB18_9FLAO|nr:pyridoxal phosphate-dependent aminotransferase [Haloflavibacter putidus]TQD33623.1 pyridoxal phosphate-dependent aminotransferase [Haloflavibacter putidus]